MPTPGCCDPPPAITAHLLTHYVRRHGCAAAEGDPPHGTKEDTATPQPPAPGVASLSGSRLAGPQMESQAHRQPAQEAGIGKNNPAIV
jgi:hypothetical protein